MHYIILTMLFRHRIYSNCEGTSLIENYITCTSVKAGANRSMSASASVSATVRGTHRGRTMSYSLYGLVWAVWAVWAV